MAQLRERGMVLLSVPVKKEVREWLRNQSKLLGLPQGVLIGQMIEPWEKAHDAATESLLRHILENPSPAVKAMMAREVAGEELGDVKVMVLKAKAIRNRCISENSTGERCALTDGHVGAHSLWPQEYFVTPKRGP